MADLSAAEIRQLIAAAVQSKKRAWLPSMKGKVLALIFEKPSLRTRVSFEVAAWQLGGHALYLSPAEVGLGKRESIADVARVLSRFVDAIAARTFAHETVVQLAQSATVPVINALSDFEHPCQALADLATVYEKKGELAGLTLAYVGDGNNVANSLMLAALRMGMNFNIAAPAGYKVTRTVLAQARQYAAESGGRILDTADPRQAVKGADVVYTDVWTSMGQEAESEERRRVFAGYQVNPALVALAKPDALVMHPLPAHRGEEVVDEVLESSQSVVFDEAENRLHVQKALLARMLGDTGRNFPG